MRFRWASSESPSLACRLDDNGGARIDLTTGGMIVDHAPGAGNDAAAMALARGLIIAGRNSGDWQATTGGITSAAAAANPSGRAVGYALGLDLLGAGGGTFMGQPADASSVLVRLTVAGD